MYGIHLVIAHIQCFETWTFFDMHAASHERSHFLIPSRTWTSWDSRGDIVLLGTFETFLEHLERCQVGSAAGICLLPIIFNTAHIYHNILPRGLATVLNANPKDNFSILPSTARGCSAANRVQAAKIRPADQILAKSRKRRLSVWF
ncbi:hypothetical protein MKZ38_001209 [Zalerion maritima]|uniref:Uncharacterized protein n=1 Tax=Zalerion maritima TaxID=339359 RepID=A0AAD5RXQ7_9PEZI|nr:hypothetical protein MKZ38_001209 [Zalerion maritima]